MSVLEWVLERKDVFSSLLYLCYGGTLVSVCIFQRTVPKRIRKFQNLKNLLVNTFVLRQKVDL
jgi:hypothetical protein